MKCPYCNHYDTKVNDSRPTDDYSKIRRRRECLKCEKRFTTYEIVETAPIIVIKKDGSRELFNRQKLTNSLMRAFEKRSMPIEEIDKAVDNIEQSILNSMDREVTSVDLGDMVLAELRGIDEVAYVRFASIYHSFKNIDSFMEELRNLHNSGD